MLDSRKEYTGGIKMKIFKRIFVDGLTGMTLGLFATLVMGIILQQIGSWIGSAEGTMIMTMAALLKMMTGAGIGIGVASRLEEHPLIVVSAAAAGMAGAFAPAIIAGSLTVKSGLQISGYGEPLSAFLAAYVGIELGRLFIGRTNLDIILSPLVTIAAGSIVGLLAGPYLTLLIEKISHIVQWGTKQEPFLMGMVVAVLMGMILTLPFGASAIAVSLHLTGIAAGAATVGCCVQMVGFAAASYRENGFGGMLAQGIGTPMLQLPNIIRRPWIWLPTILTSAVLGPISTLLFKMTNSAAGAGVGTCGLLGPFSAYHSMVSAGRPELAALIIVVLMCFVAPIVVTYVIAEAMRRLGVIKDGDMQIEV